MSSTVINSLKHISRIFANACTPGLSICADIAASISSLQKGLESSVHSAQQCTMSAVRAVEVEHANVVLSENLNSVMANSGVVSDAYRCGTEQELGRH